MQLLSNEHLLLRRQNGQELLRAANALESVDRQIAVLSSFNVDFLAPFLAERLHSVGLNGSVYIGPFGQIAQEALVPDSGLYRCQPRQILLVLASEDLLAPLFARPADFSAEASAKMVTARLHELQDIVKALLQHAPSASCYLAVIDAIDPPNPHILDPNSTLRGQVAAMELVRGIERLSGLSPQIATMDWRGPVAQIGSRACHDHRLWYLARMRLNQQGLAQLADLTARHIAATSVVAKKVIAVDLDDTLWGGVVGEVGLGGIVLGDEGLGLAFQDFQRELLKLRDTGVLLTACSKNNADDAWEVLDRHPGMILRREHFAAARINWLDKATNLQELAAELSLGLDSFVFLDDNPVERARVRGSLPEVYAPELPNDPVDRPGFLREMTSFARIDVTHTDLQRAADYQANVERVKVRETVTSLDDFIASLEQQIDIAPLSEAGLNRAAQMCQRSNQFNLTTKRYSVGELSAMVKDETVCASTVAVRDRFGDNGTVGLAILKFHDDEAELDTLLLSCRVLGRGVERELLRHLIQLVRDRHGRRIVGRYLRTSKNQQVDSFLRSGGIEMNDRDEFSISTEPT